MAERSCASTVAHATPTIPNLKTATNNTSSKALQSVDNIRKYKDTLLFPNDLKIAENILYATVVTIPQHRMKMYVYACWYIFSGVFKKDSKVFKNTVVNVVSVIHTPALIIIVEATDFFICLILFAPKYLVISMAQPLFIPNAKLITILQRAAVAPIAAIALSPKVYPTTIVSTMLYAFWKTLPINNGMVKRKIIWNWNKGAILIMDNENVKYLINMIYNTRC